MIRGVDKAMRKAIKDAAKAEGISIGAWVTRALRRALDRAPDQPADIVTLADAVEMLDARVTMLEQAQVAERPGAAKEKK